MDCATLIQPAGTGFESEFVIIGQCTLYHLEIQSFDTDVGYPAKLRLPAQGDGKRHKQFLFQAPDGDWSEVQLCQGVVRAEPHVHCGHNQSCAASWTGQVIQELWGWLSFPSHCIRCIWAEKLKIKRTKSAINGNKFNTCCGWGGIW